MLREDNISKIIVPDQSSNPAPLGLLGFGMTTILLNIHNAGFIELNSMIIGMGLFMGGLAQLFAGLQEWNKKNTFGATAFIAYACFWFSLVAIWLIPKTGFGASFKSSETSVAFYLTFWGIFTLYMFVGTLRLNKILQVVFFTLTVLFFLLAAADFTGNTNIRVIAGYEGIFCGLAAMYGSAAILLNEVYGYELLPIGAFKKSIT